MEPAPLGVFSFRLLDWGNLASFLTSVGPLTPIVDTNRLPHLDVCWCRDNIKVAWDSYWTEPPQPSVSTDPEPDGCDLWIRHRRFESFRPSQPPEYRSAMDGRNPPD